MDIWMDIWMEGGWMVAWMVRWIGCRDMWLDDGLMYVIIFNHI